MTFGVTSTGFVPKKVQDIVADIEADQKDLLDANIDTDPDGPLGQLNGIQASKMAEVWEALNTAYDAFNPDATEGFLLDALCALTGTKRNAAKASYVHATVNLNGVTDLPIGATANVSGQPSNLWLAVQGIGLPAGVAARNSGGSAADIDCLFVASQDGPTVANAGTLTVITTPSAGWNSITNVKDATLGSNQETDTQLRVKRNEELAAAGATTVDGIRADLLRLDGMEEVIVFENTGDIVDSLGQPPHCTHAVIDDGATPAVADADIAVVLWKDKGGGIKPYGSTTALTPDSRGNYQPVSFSRVVRRNIWLDLTLTVDATFPGTGAQDVKDALAAYWAAHQHTGQGVIALAYRAAALTVQGVIDVPSLRLDFHSSPLATANLVVGAFERAIVDTSRITVA